MNEKSQSLQYVVLEKLDSCTKKRMTLEHFLTSYTKKIKTKNALKM